MAQANPPQELPAWLESLRAGERSVPPKNAAPQFPTAEFVEEGALPSWMRAERNETQGVTGSNTTLRRSTNSAPDTGDAIMPSNIAAGSLIDEQALPGWMQEGKSGAMSPQNGFSASSLVQPENAPDWMKSLQQQHPAAPGNANAGRPAPVPATSVDPAPPSPSGTGFSARDLIDQQSLPSWMTQQGGQPSAPAPAPASSPAPQAGPAATPLPPLSPSGTGFSARDLIDQQSMPSWMSQLGGQPAASPGVPPSQPGPAATPSGTGFSARDLVDQQSLPSWITQQGSQPMGAPGASEPTRQREPQPPPQAQPGQGMAASSLLDMNSLPSWLRESGQGQSARSPMPPSQLAQGLQGNQVPASSLVDANSLPDWLSDQDSTSGQPPLPGTGVPTGIPVAGGRPGPAGPPRVENIRVPSRPRGEVNASDTSEVAANVFSSMLGVAAGAPNYPSPQPGGIGQPYQQPVQRSQGAQPSQMGYNPGQSSIHGGQMGQPGMSGAPNMAASTPGFQGMPGQAGMSYPGSGMMSNTPSGTYGGMQPPGYISPSMAGMPNPGAPGGPAGPGAVGNPYSPYPSGNQPNPMNNPAMGPSQSSPASYSGMGSGAGQAPGSDQKQGKKRGIVGALLDWLAR